MKPDTDSDRYPDGIAHEQSRLRYIEFFTASSIGVVAFILVADLRILLPQNIAWLELGDPPSHYLGWEFFRNTDWTFPLGLNPNYGGEFGSSIVYSDSNALLAFLFKFFDQVLPEPFQYFGLWILICFVMQSIIAWKIMSLVTKDIILKALAASFFVFSPPMIWRLFGHFNLFAHFLVLGGLLLSVSPPARGREKYWILTLVLAAATHAYLFAMLLALWTSHVANDYFTRLRTLKQTLVHVTTCAIVLPLVAWQVGYFSVRNGVTTGGYGVYKANLLTFFDSENWSFILADIPNHAAEIEGFAYLGTGVILVILPVAAYHLVTRGPLVSNLHFNRFLIATLLVLFAFALSHKLAIAGHNVESVFLKPLEHIGNAFRASGRMIWPVYYAILIFILAMVIVYTPRKVAVPVMGTALLVQIIDTSAAWPAIKRRLVQEPRSEWATTMRSPFWKMLAKRYNRVQIYPPQNQHQNWREIAYFAQKNNLQTNAVYLARVDTVKMQEEERKFVSYVSSGKYPTDTFFIINDPFFRSLLLRTDGNEGNGNGVARVNGYFVFAPDWNNCTSCPPLPDPVPDDVVRVNVGEKIVPNTKAKNDRYLISGWSGPEPAGTWTDGKFSLIVLPVSNRARQVVLDILPFITPKHPQQTVNISVNGEFVTSVDLGRDSFHQVNLNIARHVDSATDRSFTFLRIELMLPDAVSPLEIGLSKDSRQLGVALRAISVF